jgi:hypothetical protein
LRAGLACNLDGVSIVASFQDHDGKIDLNNAGTALLRVGFQAAGLTADQARLLQEYVEASRSGGSLPQELQNMTDVPALKGVAFERVEEIYDMTEALRLQSRDLDRYFTVYKRNGGLELATTPEDLQALLQLGPGIEGVSDTDNGSFEYLDVTLRAILQSGRVLGLRKAYRRVNNAGEVSEIARKEMFGVSTPLLPKKVRYPNCIDLVKAGQSEVGNG